MAAVGCLHRIALSRSASDRRPVAQPLIRKVSWAVCPATGLTGQTVAGMRCASDGGQRGVGGWRRQHDGRLLRDCRACAAGPAGAVPGSCRRHRLRPACSCSRWRRGYWLHRCPRCCSPATGRCRRRDCSSSCQYWPVASALAVRCRRSVAGRCWTGRPHRCRGRRNRSRSCHPLPSRSRR